MLFSGYRSSQALPDDLAASHLEMHPSSSSGPRLNGRPTHLNNSLIALTDKSSCRADGRRPSSLRTRTSSTAAGQASQHAGREGQGGGGGGKRRSSRNTTRSDESLWQLPPHSHDLEAAGSPCVICSWWSHLSVGVSLVVDHVLEGAVLQHLLPVHALPERRAVDHVEPVGGQVRASVHPVVEVVQPLARPTQVQHLTTNQHHKNASGSATCLTILTAAARGVGWYGWARPLTWSISV